MEQREFVDDPAQIELWNDRATLGEMAGTQDRMAKRLEVATLRDVVRGPRVLDAGCGDGETLLTLIRENPAITEGTGIDFSPGMLARARVSALVDRAVRIRFLEGSLLDPPFEEFDTVYTERALINLRTWKEQEFALRRLADAVAPGGQLCIMENCNDGLRVLNRFRAICQLPIIYPPAHNRYLEAVEINAVGLPGFLGPKEVCYSDAYYWHSRIVNAYDAQERLAAPRYDSPINFLAVGLRGVLPAWPIHCGQGRLWMWERER